MQKGAERKDGGLEVCTFVRNMQSHLSVLLNAYGVQYATCSMRHQVWVEEYRLQYPGMLIRLVVLARLLGECRILLPGH
jgi:hypothetical protein